MFYDHFGELFPFDDLDSDPLIVKVLFGRLKRLEMDQDVSTIPRFAELRLNATPVRAFS